MLSYKPFVNRTVISNNKNKKKNEENVTVFIDLLSLCSMPKKSLTIM